MTRQEALKRYCEKRGLKVVREYDTMGGEDRFGNPRGLHYRAVVETADGHQYRLFYNNNPRKFGGPVRGWQKR